MTIIFLLISSIQLSMANSQGPSKVTSKIIHCTHVQVCNSIRFTLGENKEYIVKNLINTQHEDPHHFEPSVGDIKSLMKSKVLILPPLELQPWLKNIKLKRSNQKGKKTLSLIEPNEHFWLGYNSLCNVLKQLAQFFPKNILSTKQTCQNSKKAHLYSKLKDKMFILLHDSLGKYFEELNLKYFALRGHGHLEKLSTKAIKKVHLYKKIHQQLIWIYEKQISIPTSLKNYTSKTDQILTIDTLGRNGTSPFEVLNTLSKKLEQI
jgi:ABC-type Zn uptake system ZnuABC Zn-binding protein ZnuA